MVTRRTAAAALFSSGPSGVLAGAFTWGSQDLGALLYGAQSEGGRASHT